MTRIFLPKDGLQELGAALVRDSRAKVTSQEPESDHAYIDDDGNHDGDDADDHDVYVIDFVDIDNESLYDGVLGHQADQGRPK